MSCGVESHGRRDRFEESFNSAVLYEIGRDDDVSRIGGLWELKDANAASCQGSTNGCTKSEVVYVPSFYRLNLRRSSNAARHPVSSC